jgi:hypothetical protein
MVSAVSAAESRCTATVKRRVVPDAAPAGKLRVPAAAA